MGGIKLTNECQHINIIVTFYPTVFILLQYGFVVLFRSFRIQRWNCTMADFCYVSENSLVFRSKELDQIDDSEHMTYMTAIK